jgi:hypothetical protein
VVVAFAPVMFSLKPFWFSHRSSVVLNFWATEIILTRTRKCCEYFVNYDHTHSCYIRQPSYPL